MTSQNRKKIANIYINPETHATLKALAAHQETTLQGTAAHWLEEMQPMMQEMVTAFDEIKSGKNAQNVLQNFMAKGLHMAADNLITEEEENVTDNGKSD
jgi:hypothetical protein